MGDAVKIETHIHGSSSDAALWAALGPFLVDRKVVAELGGLPVYSVPGMHWFIARDDGRVVGFAAMRLTPKAIWYDYGYVIPEQRGRGVFASLAKIRDAESAHENAPLRAAIRSERWKHYRQRGWKIASKRGSWLHIIKEKS